MEKLVSKIRLVKSWFTGKYSLKTQKGKRITQWFDLYLFYDRSIGDFVRLETDIGTIIYHKQQENLLYFGQVKDEYAYIYDLNEDVYYLQIESPEYSDRIRLYYSNGEETGVTTLEEVYVINKDNIAAKEFCGKWGLLDKELKWKVYPVYDDIFDVNRKIICGVTSNEGTTDVMTINGDSGLDVTTIEGSFVDYLTPWLIRTAKNKKYGVYNIDGEKILDIQYDSIKHTGNYLVISKDGLYGVVDVDGKMICECNYHSIKKTENGFDMVQRQVIDVIEHITI